MRGSCSALAWFSCGSQIDWSPWAISVLVLATYSTPRTLATTVASSICIASRLPSKSASFILAFDLHVVGQVAGGNAMRQRHGFCTGCVTLKGMNQISTMPTTTMTSVATSMAFSAELTVSFTLLAAPAVLVKVRAQDVLHGDIRLPKDLRRFFCKGLACQRLGFVRGICCAKDPQGVFGDGEIGIAKALVFGVERFFSVALRRISVGVGQQGGGVNFGGLGQRDLQSLEFGRKPPRRCGHHWSPGR